MGDLYEKKMLDLLEEVRILKHKLNTAKQQLQFRRNIARRNLDDK